LDNLAKRYLFPELRLISVGSFNVLCLVCSGWHVTVSILTNFIANDTKYLQLRLDTAPKILSFTFTNWTVYINRSPIFGKKVLDAEEE
jgi:hypothetical protein